MTAADGRAAVHAQIAAPMAPDESPADAYVRRTAGFARLYLIERTELGGVGDPDSLATAHTFHRGRGPFQLHLMRRPRL